MLLRRHLLRVASPLPVPSLSSLFRLLSTSTSTSTSPSSSHFAVEDYLLTTCHLTPTQALRAANHLSHLKSPSNPDAVLAFLANLGLSAADISATVASDPRLLCSSVDKTLQARAAELRELGLSPPQIARLVPLARSSFRRTTVGRNLRILLSVFGSFDVVLRAVTVNSSVLSCGVETVLKPNISLLKQCGLDACHIARYRPAMKLLTRNPEKLEAMVGIAEKLGVPRSSRMFRYALLTYSSMGPQKIAAKLALLKTLGWSEADLRVAVSRFPLLLTSSEEKLRRAMEFLTIDVGLEVAYVASNPALLKYSIEGRLAPRLYVINTLKAKGLLKDKYGFYSAAAMGEKKFLEKFVHAHKESVPGLTEAYAAACAGKVPIGLRVAS